MRLQDICPPKPSLLDFARRVPKVEAGDVTGPRRNSWHPLSPEQQRVLAPGGERSLSDCFKVFDTIHTVVSDLSAVRRIALEALQDMRHNNVRYAELRTTPRPLADGTSRRDYIESVLRVFRDFEASQATALLGVSGNNAGASESVNLADESLPALPARRLVPRLLISVDRGESVEEAIEVAKLAVELRATDEYKPYVLGMDFSGNPTKGSFKDFRLAFELARSSGLKVTVHCGEVLNDADVLEVIAFRPERLGHAVVLGEEVRQTLLSLVPRIPIEVCPTSKPPYPSALPPWEHPTVRGWIKNGYPFSVNTDDSGVFDTDLATEFAHLATSNDLDERGIARLSCRAVQDVFDDGWRPVLAASFRKECDLLLGSVKPCTTRRIPRGRGMGDCFKLPPSSASLPITGYTTKHKQHVLSQEKNHV